MRTFKVTTTKAQAAAIILAAIAKGRLAGGRYLRTEKLEGTKGDTGVGVAYPGYKEGQRRAIGHLLSRKQAFELEARTIADLQHIGGYPLASQLIAADMLGVDDPQWFIEAKQKTDAVGIPGKGYSCSDWSELEAHCRAALPTLGYDIGNRRSDPVYR